MNFFIKDFSHLLEKYLWKTTTMDNFLFGAVQAIKQPYIFLISIVCISIILKWLIKKSSRGVLKTQSNFYNGAFF